MVEVTCRIKVRAANGVQYLLVSGLRAASVGTSFYGRYDTLSSGSVVLSYRGGVSSATFGITKNHTVQTVE